MADANYSLPLVGPFVTLRASVKLNNACLGPRSQEWYTINVRPDSGWGRQELADHLMALYHAFPTYNPFPGNPGHHPPAQHDWAATMLEIRRHCYVVQDSHVVINKSTGLANLEGSKCRFRS